MRWSNWLGSKFSGGNSGGSGLVRPFLERKIDFLCLILILSSVSYLFWIKNVVEIALGVVVLGVTI